MTTGAACPRPPAAIGDGRAALVVDDEPLVLMMCAEMLRDMGFEVLEAMAGAAALQVLQERPDIGLLLTDIRMPGMNGYELADRARGRLPDIKIIFVSGYCDPQTTVLAPLLPKPYSAWDLGRLVETQLQP